MCCPFASGLVSSECSLLSDLIWEITLIVKTPNECGLSSSTSAMEMPIAVSEPYLMLQGFLWRGKRSETGRPTARSRPRCGIRISQLEEVCCPAVWGLPPPFPPEAQGHCQQSREGHRDPTTLALPQLRHSGLPAVQGQPRTVRARACPSGVVAASANPHGTKPRGGGPPPAPPPAPSGGVRGPLPERRQTGRPVSFTSQLAFCPPLRAWAPLAPAQSPPALRQLMRCSRRGAPRSSSGPRPAAGAGRSACGRPCHSAR